MPKRSFSPPTAERLSPTQTGENAPTITPAGSEHNGDSSITSQLDASRNFESGNRPEIYLSRRQLVGGGAIALVASLAAGSIWLSSRGEDPEEHSEPARTTVSTSEGPSTTNAPELVPASLDVQVPLLQPGEYYPAPPTHSPEAMLQSLCMARTAAINSVGATLEERRTDMLWLVYKITPESDKLAADFLLLDNFYRLQRDVDPSFRFYLDCEVLDSQPSQRPGSLWDITAIEKSYIIDTNGSVVDYQASMWNLELRKDTVSLQNGFSDERGVIGAARPVED